jgi:hypothetical protein
MIKALNSKQLKLYQEIIFILNFGNYNLVPL